MQPIITLFSLSLLAALAVTSPAHAHQKKCTEFRSYQEAVQHCKAVPPHQFPQNCGNHDRDKDGRPCECQPGGPEADSQACKSKRARK